MTPVRSTARVLLSAMFITGGWNQIRRLDQHVEAAKPVTDKVGPALKTVHPKAPSETRTLVLANGVTQLAGGLLLATGRATRPAAAVLAATLVPTTFAGHRFWEYKDPEMRTQQQIHFLKNLAMLGGLLLAAVDTAGKPGLAWRTSHLARHARTSAARAAEDASRTVKRAADDATRSVRQATQGAQYAVRSTTRGAQHAIKTAGVRTRLVVRRG